MGIKEEAFRMIEASKKRFKVNEAFAKELLTRYPELRADPKFIELLVWLYDGQTVSDTLKEWINSLKE